MSQEENIMQPALRKRWYRDNFNGIHILRAVVLAEAIAIMLAFAPGVTEDHWYRLGLSTLFVQWVTILTIIMIYLFRHHLGRSKPGTRLIYTCLILVLSTIIVSNVAFNILSHFRWLSDQNMEDFFISNTYIALAASIIGAQFYWIHLDRMQAIAAEAEARLCALQAQIKPHFIFNCLNTLAELTHTSPKTAEKAILNLSDLFRAATNIGETETLENELLITNSYIELEKLRLGNRLLVSIETPDIIPNIHLPVLTLQPLVENSIRHGIEGCSQGGMVTLTIHEKDIHVEIKIKNPIGKPSTHIKHAGVAVTNIIKRLDIFYKGRAKFNQILYNDIHETTILLPKDGDDAYSSYR